MPAYDCQGPTTCQRQSAMAPLSPGMTVETTLSKRQGSRHVRRILTPKPSATGPCRLMPGPSVGVTDRSDDTAIVRGRRLDFHCEDQERHFQVVIDRQCNITCNQYFTKVRLNPGQFATDVESPDGVSSPDKLFSSSGATIGCLPLRFSRTPPHSLEIDVSQSVPCGGSSGSKATAGHDWPYRNY
jgi:hypothetical protein